MTKDDIITLPNPNLRLESEKVKLVDSTVLSVIEDMESATLDWEASRNHEVGVALAAIQINQRLKIVVIREDTNDKDNHGFQAFINPEITKQEGALVEDYEGCLSVPEVYGRIPRYEKIRLKALDIHGNEVRFKASGFLARTLQHEIDHTRGVLIVDHIKNNPEAFFYLTDDGELAQLDYQKNIVNNQVLWG